jgi:hypothetical protein
MTNVMHKFIIYLTIYFCLIGFGLLLGPVQRQVNKYGSGSKLVGTVSAPQWTRTSAIVVQLPLNRAQKKPETCKAELKRYIK